jgi:hypothetical protein
MVRKKDCYSFQPLQMSNFHIDQVLRNGSFANNCMLGCTHPQTTYILQLKCIYLFFQY